MSSSSLKSRLLLPVALAVPEVGRLLGRCDEMDHQDHEEELRLRLRGRASLHP